MFCTGSWTRWKTLTVARWMASPLRILGGVLMALAASAAPGAVQHSVAQESTAQQTEVVIAVLQGLDKTTARVSTFEAPVDGSAKFGTLRIVARACHKKPPTETPESAAFLEIVDERPDSPSIGVFTGWMFASSPALSAMEHPVYDVWVIDCRKGLMPVEPIPAEPKATDTVAPDGASVPVNGD